jgi:hypothetical protein
MAYVMCQYDRPTDTRNWTEYNKHVRDWIAQLLKVSGAISFMGYHTTDGSSPNTITMLEFRSVEEARRAAKSDEIQAGPRRSGVRWGSSPGHSRGKVALHSRADPALSRATTERST